MAASERPGLGGVSAEPQQRKSERDRGPGPRHLSTLVFSVAILLVGLMLVVLSFSIMADVGDAARRDKESLEVMNTGTRHDDAARLIALKRRDQIGDDVLTIKDKINKFEGRLVALLDSEDGRYVAGCGEVYRRFRELDREPRRSGGYVEGVGDNANRMVKDYPLHAVSGNLSAADGYEQATRDMERLSRELEVISGDYDRLNGKLDALIADALRAGERHRQSLRDFMATPIGGVRR
jgi:hypothetical protein